MLRPGLMGMTGMLRLQLSPSLARCRTVVTSAGGARKKKVNLGEQLSGKRSKRAASQTDKISWQVLGSGAR